MKHRLALGFLALSLLSGGCSGEDDPASDADGAASGSGGSRNDAGTSSGGGQSGSESGSGASSSAGENGGAQTGSGAASSGGGATGGNAGESGMGPGPGAVCPDNAAFCESFEDGDGLDTSRWTVNADDGVFVVDSDFAADGSRSLHMQYGQPYGATGIQVLETDGMPAPGDRLYVRSYMRFADLSLPGAHPFFITVADGSVFMAFGSIINDFALMVVGKGLDNPQIWYEGGGFHDAFEDGDETPETENGLQAGDWICVEMMVFGGGDDLDSEEGRVWINGEEIDDMYADDSRWPSPADRWTPVLDGSPWLFGVESFGPENVALDIWFDAIVISEEPIGCIP